MNDRLYHLKIRKETKMTSLFIDRAIIEWNKIEEDSYLRDIKAIHNVEEIIFRNAVTFFVGENGSGKSTLLEAIAAAYGFNPEGGTKNYSFSTRDSHSELYKTISVEMEFIYWMSRRQRFHRSGS